MTQNVLYKRRQSDRSTLFLNIDFGAHDKLVAWHLETLVPSLLYICQLKCINVKYVLSNVHKLNDELDHC